uniref:phospholipase D n=1 Tax=Odontella aurita TaxID=265563 RepID=A0A7S4N196_9STRA|mmetsp:Transcript_4288/g.11948  ORF Transcript_4288/g.11948 Transcript_4288/m.11948 type:complete len:954 (+) Transcript_4288:341-3202(+)
MNASSPPLCRSPMHQRYRRRGDRILLHGVLHIKIVRCRKLRNTDGLLALKIDRTMQGSLTKIRRNLSDPFVSVRAGKHRIAKTSIIMDNLNPEWNEDFYCHIGHYLTDLKFEVKDKDFGMRADLIGTHLLPVEELIKYDETTGKPLRVGTHKIAVLDGKEKHGFLEYFIEFVPKEMLTSKCEVPGVYFGMRPRNDVRLYCNADDGAEGLPVVKYGGAEDNEKTWTPRRLWRDIYDAICGAEHFIYITGWAVDTTQSLLRGIEKEDALANSKYSPYIGQLLEQKSEEGVIVNLLVWDDSTSNHTFHAIMPGMMGTHDEETNDRFRRTPGVTCKLAPMMGDETNAFHEKAGKFVMFTHHQKLIIVDAAPPEERRDSTEREPLAFVGGVDLTDGRWDNHTHPLFRTLLSHHKGDAYSNCFHVDANASGPRQPWRDIHSSVRGHGVLDVLENFKERWMAQAKDEVIKLLDMGHRGKVLSQFVEAGVDSRRLYGGWCTQLFRSIDARTATFQTGNMGKAYVDPGSVDDWLGSFHGDEMKPERGKADHHTITKITKRALHKAEGKSNLLRGLKEKAKGSKTLGKLKEKTEKAAEKTGLKFSDPENLGKAFYSPDVDSFRYMRTLSQKKGRDVDDSVHSGLVHHLRRAEHCLYMESQYFLGSAHTWEGHREVKCNNLIPSEITLKILEKIEKCERFAAYIVLPMWPEGIPHTGAVQSILYWQRHTLESMYRTIGEALRIRRLSVRDGSMRGSMAAEDIAAHPSDYLNFYCLATRESIDGSQAAPSPSHKPTADEELLTQTRRHQIYVHSKMTIIDDSVAIIGSANVNQRSLDGARDSEVLMGCYQPNHMATPDALPHGDVHGFRMHCWATTMGKFEHIFRDPSSLECVQRVNEIAEENWRRYTAPGEPRDMNSYLVPYPIEVREDGTIQARSDLKGGCFPDTRAKVLGTKSMTIPEILTT